MKLILLNLLFFIFSWGKENVEPQYIASPNVELDTFSIKSDTLITLNKVLTNPVIGVYGTSIDYGLGATNIYDSSWVGRFKKSANLLGYTVINYGVSNTTYMDSLPYSIWPKIKYTKNVHLDIIILGGATNDGQNQYANQSSKRFYREYKRVIDSLRKWHPSVQIIVNTAIKSKHNLVPQARLDTLINPTIINVANIYNLRVCNLSALPNTILSSDLLHPNDAGLHPNDAGYRKIHQAFYDWFFYDKYIDKELIEIEPLIGE